MIIGRKYVSGVNIQEEHHIPSQTDRQDQTAVYNQTERQDQTAVYSQQNSSSVVSDQIVESSVIVSSFTEIAANTAGDIESTSQVTPSSLDSTASQVTPSSLDSTASQASYLVS